MLRALRVIYTKVRFVPAPFFTTTTANMENGKRPASSRSTATATRSYAPQDLPVYDYDLVVVGGGSGGEKIRRACASLPTFSHH
jgi:hypothetical protein